MDINIFNIQHFSLYDGPGIRTVVFFSGCPLNCSWCHNPESKTSTPKLFYYEKKCISCKKCKDICPVGAHTFRDKIHLIDRNCCTLCGKCSDICSAAALEIIGKTMDTDEIIAEIEKDDIFFASGGGVTISGGEPFSQPEALLDLVKKCKKKDYNVYIETSGFTPKENITDIAPYIDGFLYDCKETDRQLHMKYTNEDNTQILENLHTLDELDANVILRCPIIPGINNRNEHFEGIAKLANTHKSIKYIELMPYHPLGISKSEQIGEKSEFLYDKFLEKEETEKYAAITKKYTAKDVKISGIS